MAIKILLGFSGRLIKETRRFTCQIIASGTLLLLSIGDVVHLVTNNVTCNVIVQGYLRCWKINEMVTFMKELIRRGFSFDATTAELIVKAISENPSVLNMITELHAENKKCISFSWFIRLCYIRFRFITSDEWHPMQLWKMKNDNQNFAWAFRQAYRGGARLH